MGRHGQKRQGKSSPATIKSPTSNQLWAAGELVSRDRSSCRLWGVRQRCASLL